MNDNSTKQSNMNNTMHGIITGFETVQNSAIRSKMKDGQCEGLGSALGSASHSKRIYDSNSSARLKLITNRVGKLIDTDHLVLKSALTRE